MDPRTLATGVSAPSSATAWGRTLSGLAVLGLALLPLTGQAAEKRLDRDFPVTPGGTLTVEADSADVIVSGTDKDQVEVHIVATGSQAAVDNLTMTAEATANGVKVTSKRRFSLRGSFGNFDSKVQITVPGRYNLDLGTAGGDISVTRVQGSVGGTTAGGNVRLSGVQGDVKIRTSGGDIDAQDLTGDNELATTGGNIFVRAVTGNSRLTTTGGDVRLERLQGSVQASSGGGNILATDIHGDSILKSTGGNVRAQGLDGRIEAESFGGNIAAELVGANRGIDVHTTGGDIALRLAADTKGALDAVSTGGSVSSDIPVTVTRSREHELRGPINGGGPAIRARTTGGNIELKTGR